MSQARTVILALAAVFLAAVHSDCAEPAAEKKHWAYVAPRAAVPPDVKDAAWPANAIDRFILARLEQERLLRRVSLDLIGLPPSLREADAFLADASPNAYERLVDRLLASPHYGERWGRHWLDLARFAETDGFEHDAARPTAWRYRDYVIRAFNADKPYDRFVREQVAGDQLWPDDPDARVATGFARLGMWDAMSKDPARQRQ